MLLELAGDYGLNLRKTSNCKGGEYHSNCPACEDGIDRFVIWPQLNRYWCRRCKINGDGIQFCRDFLGMTFNEACTKVSNFFKPNIKKEGHQEFLNRFNVALEPPKLWQEKAYAFVQWSQNLLQQSSDMLQTLYLRGLKENTIKQYRLGFCENPVPGSSKDFFRNREEWGLSSECKPNGKPKQLWLASGLVIPTMSIGGSVYKLKVRRHQWHKEDPLPKYVEISGSMQCPSVFGETQSKVAVVVESEFDALLILQNATDLCFCIALGGVTKKPDLHTDHLLKQAKLILWCLDNDEAGRNVAFWWRSTYQNLRFWPAPVGKSPGDAFKDHKLNLRNWILNGINCYLKTEVSLENSMKDIGNND